MAWYTGFAIRKYAIKILDINKTYNIETLTGTKFKNPKIFYSIKEYYASTPLHHIDIECKLTYPNVIFENIGVKSTIYDNFFWNNNETSKVVMFITEGDIGV